MTVKQINDVVTLSIAFTDNGAPLDPDTVRFKVKPPSGEVVVYEYETDEELVRDSAGNYHVDVTLDERGLWLHEWEGVGHGVEYGELMVEGRDFTVSV